MDSYYIHNRETGKLELHFDKSEYDALTDEQHSEIKSAFLWGRRSGCWISRAKEPNLWRAEHVAKALGLEDGGEQGERLSFAEQQERKAERAEHRAERFEIKADAEEKRGEALQAPINRVHGDIAFFTQPNINTTAGRAFTRQREKMWEAFRKGFDAFNKSDYYRQRAQAAQRTADRVELKDRAFLNRRIEECETSIRKFKRNIDMCELYSKTSPEKAEGYAKQIDYWAERIEIELDKLGYYQDAMDALGGVQYSRENVKPGYIVRIGRYKNNPMKVLSCGPKNFTGMAGDGLALKYPYAEITEIVRAEEEKPEDTVQPFKVGESFNVRGETYTIIKATAKTVTYRSETGEVTRTTPKRQPKQDGSGEQWRIAVGSGWRCEYFYRT